VVADPERLAEASSLLDNALRYTPAPGTVTIAARREGGGVAFSVRDSGMGIDAEHLPHVFERFYRVDRSRARTSGGSGVGLTIARALATAMGGTPTRNQRLAVDVHVVLPADKTGDLRSGLYGWPATVLNESLRTAAVS
jgi:signal transduction histidine kinase